MKKRASSFPDITRRAELMLGHSCNARCRFCYFVDTVGRGGREFDLTTGEAEKTLGRIRREGMTDVEFTGGEPTVRKDLFKLAAFARDIGFVNISLITNGLMLSDPGYARQLRAAGVNDVILSVHGHTSELHDAQTGVPGSFEKIMKAAVNVKESGARVRSNTVINGMNYRYASDILTLLLAMDMKAIYFVLFNPIIEAQNADDRVFVSYSDAAESVAAAIDQHESRLPCFSVKYIPFCYLKGYERYVMNCPQQNYDPDEWNIYVSYKISLKNSGWIRRRLSLLSIICRELMGLKEYGYPLKHGWQGLKTRAVTQHVERIGKTCMDKCRECRYYYVCDFIWTTCLERYGDDGVLPVQGPAIRNPVWSYLGSRHRRPGDPVA